MLAACAGKSGSPKNDHAAAAGSKVKPAPVSNTVSTSRLREEAIQRIEQLANSPDAQVRANAIEAAIASPTRLRGIIERGCDDPQPAVRMVAAMAVGRAKLRDMVPRVRPLLHDGEQQVRGAAIYALARNNIEVDQSQLATMLLSDASPWTSRQAVFLLGDLGNRTAVPLLYSALRDRVAAMPAGQQRVFQLQVAEALAKLGDEQQRSVLRAALFPSQVEDLEATALAAQALGDLGDAQSLGQFSNMLVYRDRAGQPYPAEVRLSIAASLARLSRANAPESERATKLVAGVAEEFSVSTDPGLRAQAAFVYGSHRAPAYWDQLAALLKDPEQRVQVAAAAALLKSSQ
jgi:HEAT repeat protein